jgi:hypothetical protein
MKKWILIAFSLYVIVEVFYLSLGDPEADIYNDAFQRILTSLYYSGKEILIITLSATVGLLMHELWIRIPMLILVIYNLFQVIFSIFLMLNMAVLSSLLWSGFLIIVIFVLIIIALTHE